MERNYKMGNFDRKKNPPCLHCMKALKWIPVLFITAVIAWSYYAYFVELCLFSIDNVFEKIVFLIFFHIILFLFLWAYANTIFTPVGTVPANWRILDADYERLLRTDNPEQQKRILDQCAKNLPVTNRTLNGSVRFCHACRIIKPDRAHHCSVCGTCVLKMDHHCPWVNNCVNFSNYKYFVLFLGYALLYCLYVALTSLEYFIRFWKGDLNGGMGRFHILFLFFVSIMFAISLVSLFGYHAYLVLMNRTTLEAFRAPIFHIGGPDKNGYNLGKYANFQEVFGDNWKLWFLPVFSSLGDGLQYPTRAHVHSNYESMGATQNRLDVQPTDKLIATNEIALNNHNNHDYHQPSPPTIEINTHHNIHQLQEAQQTNAIMNADDNMNASKSHCVTTTAVVIDNVDIANDSGINANANVPSVRSSASASLPTECNVVIDLSDVDNAIMTKTEQHGINADYNDAKQNIVVNA